MLPLLHLEILQKRLRSIPELVDSQQKRLYTFPEEVLDWLKQAETELENAHLHVVSEIASLRSRLLVTLHGSEDGVGHGATQRKRRESVASSVLQEAQQIITRAIDPKIEQIREAEGLAMSVAAVARAKGVIQQASEIASHQEALQFVHGAMSQDPDTGAAIVHITGLLGAIEVLIVLDRAIPELHNQSTTAPRIQGAGAT